MTPGRLPSTKTTLDPIDRLPPELSTIFIWNALPLWNHSSRLIELTAVSKRWRGFLCSTPFLWSKLVVDERQEDFLAMLSVFVALSGKAALKITFRREPVDWTGLVSLLLPVTQRITSLIFEDSDYLEINWIPSVISTVFGRLGRLPQLKEVDFDDVVWQGGTAFRNTSLLLPPAVKLKGYFQIAMPDVSQKSATPGKFFDIIKYNTFATLDLTPSPDSFNLRYTLWPVNVTTICSNNATPALIDSLSGHLAKSNCFEQAVYWTTRHLQYLVIRIHLSQVQDAIDCLRLLMCLQTLSLHIQIEEPATILSWTPNEIACCALRVFSMVFDEDVSRIPFSTQRTLRNLFSAFQTLCPFVEELHFYGNTWPFSSSYLQSLRVLKSLHLKFTDSKYNPSERSINLPSLQYLRIEGPAHLGSLHMPNLLSLSLDLPNPEAWPTHFSHPHIRRLTIISNGSTQNIEVLSLDCTDLLHLHLQDIPCRATWGHLSLSNVVSITLTSAFDGIVNPSGNQLCLALLCNPERLPSLQQLLFGVSVDWDVLFLMLQRRNFGKNRVKRVDTVSLPFTPFALHRALTCLLAGEIVELPSLAFLSLEATREVMFDSTVYVSIPYRGKFAHRT
jgi:F-box-like